MRLRTEVSIDLDSNRKVWIVAAADDVMPGDVEEVVHGMAESLLEQAAETYEKLEPLVHPEPGPRGLASQMRTFQEDD
jgi:hypothetical protein